MNTTAHSLRAWLRRSVRLGAVRLTISMLALVPAWAQSQDAGRALNLFQQLLQPPRQNAAPAPVPANPLLPANPAQPVNPAGFLGNALIGGGNTSRAAGNAAVATDLVGLLSQSATQIELPQEIEIGRQLSAVLLGSKPLHPDMQLQRYVNQLGRWISLQSERPDLPWTFAVLDDDGFNAFAAPGGYVFVTKGLIDRVADESELAGVLAHEISHVVRKHHLEAIRKNARAGIVTQLIGSQLNNNLGGALSAQLIGLGRNLYSKGLDQEDEYEADRLGVALAAASGFDPYGLAAVLQQLRTAAPDNPVFTLALSTHPPAQLRIDQLELAMGNRLDPLSGKPAVSIPQRLGLLAMAQTPSTPAPAANINTNTAVKPPPAIKLPAKGAATKIKKP
ncbi:MAG: M48 family metallopeptidase [Betaproteobacteria bacterium]